MPLPSRKGRASGFFTAPVAAAAAFVVPSEGGSIDGARRCSCPDTALPRTGTGATARSVLLGVAPAAPPREILLLVLGESFMRCAGVAIAGRGRGGAALGAAVPPATDGRPIVRLTTGEVELAAVLLTGDATC